MPFYCVNRSTGICAVLGSKKSSTYSSEYASIFSSLVPLICQRLLRLNRGITGTDSCVSDHRTCLIFPHVGWLDAGKKNILSKVNKSDATLAHMR